MADDPLVIADLVADAFDLSDAQVSDLLTDATFMQRLPITESSNGNTHKYNKETGAPVVGFRSENAGREIDSSVDTVVTVTLKILDFSWRVDKAVADSWRKGGREALIAREGMRHVNAALFKAEQQFINGIVGASDSAGASGSSAGFTGFRDAATLDALADSLHVVNAAGTTADTASSCYLVRVGDDDVQGVFNGEAKIQLGETVVQDAIDGSGLHYPAYYTPGCLWVGMQIGGIHSVKRIVNLTADSGKGLTDALIYDALSLFPAGRQPNLIVMNRRSLKQLRASRTATNPTGFPAPRPVEVEGIPIVVTDAITNTEELVA